MSSIRHHVVTLSQQIALEWSHRGEDHEGHHLFPIPSEARVSTQPVVAPGAHTAGDFMPLHGIDHIELWVGNAQQAAYFYTHAYGFREVAYAGLETGMRDRASRVLVQGRIRLVLTGALRPDHEIALHQARHGDGVRTIALSVPDAAAAYRTAVGRGAEGVREPWELSDEHGTVRMATIATYGETLHTFVERGAYKGAFLPGYDARDGGGADAGLLAVDHIVGNVELGAMDQWVKYYEDVFGMREMTHFTDDDISTEYSALMSKVVTSGNGRIKFPLNEPAEGKRKSQIDEYLEFYGGPGAQHIAVATRDIVRTVETLMERGVEFLRTPDSYYDEVPERVGEIDENLADLRRLGILVDRDDEGYLLQIFTKPVGDRPTIFFEVIERHGARGFGDGNFKALFEAIEREQERRGNL
jgi:4-hydroxyphenylpyruvate dioxygenase